MPNAESALAGLRLGAARPDRVLEPAPAPTAGLTERRLSVGQRIVESPLARRSAILIVLAAAWEASARFAGNELIFPTLTATARAFVHDMADGPLAARTLASLGLLMQAYAIGLLLALVLVAFAVSTRLGAELLATFTAMFNPLPAIALLPIAMLWFGLGETAVIFVVVHSVLWPVTLNAYSGFQAVGETIRMAGRNMGMRGARYLFCLLIPAALPAIFSGLRTGWAFAWRTLIAAELVFGAASGSGGLGWFIFEHRNLMDTPSVFAGLATVVLIGLVVESAIFRFVETRTVQAWGMQR